MSDNNCTFTKSRGAIGSRVQALLYYFQQRRYDEGGAEGASILYTILLTLETILLEAFDSEGGDYLEKVVVVAEVVGVSPQYSVVVVVGRSSAVEVVVGGSSTIKVVVSGSSAVVVVVIVCSESVL